jgi:hypothetical protein
MEEIFYVRDSDTDELFFQGSYEDVKAWAYGWILANNPQFNISSNKPNNMEETTKPKLYDVWQGSEHLLQDKEEIVKDWLMQRCIAPNVNNEGLRVTEVDDEPTVKPIPILKLVLGMPLADMMKIASKVKDRRGATAMDEYDAWSPAEFVQKFNDSLIEESINFVKTMLGDNAIEYWKMGAVQYAEEASITNDDWDKTAALDLLPIACKMVL